MPKWIADQPIGHAVAACLAGMLALACAREASSIPGTPAGRAFNAWLVAYNSADSIQLARYAREHAPTLRVHLELLMTRRTGPWQVVSVARSEPAHLEVVLRSQPSVGAVGVEPITMYGVVDVADTATLQATTRLVFVGSGRYAPMNRINAQQRSLAIDSAAAKIARNYVDPAVGAAIAESLRARRARGVYDDYDTQISFAQRVNQDIAAVAHDPQVGVEYAWRLPLPLTLPQPAALVRCGIEPAKMLADSVGYLRVVGLEDSGLCGQFITQSMQTLRGARALILDLRENPGGIRPSMARYIATYLLDDCTQLSSIWTRTTDSTQIVWTHANLRPPTFGGDKPVYVLTSRTTAGEAEMLAYDLKTIGRAVIVGERTAGVANVTASGRAGDHLLLIVAVARAVNPITQTNWQRTGVEPDVSISAGDDALTTAMKLIQQGGTVAHPPSAAAQAPTAVASGGLVTADSLPGIQFEVDTNRAQKAWREPIVRVLGSVQFANGRGRFDVNAIRELPPMTIDSVVIAPPAAKPGDYYLFDNRGFILVRPSTRTFSSIVFARAEFNYTGMLLAGMTNIAGVSTGRRDTVRTIDRASLVEHGPLTIHWHMQTPNGGPPYSRGWLEIVDAPAVEAGAARWFEPAAALATRPGGIDTILAHPLEVTAVTSMRRPGDAFDRVALSEQLYPSHLQRVKIDAGRLILPEGFREVPWPGFASVPRASASDRWRVLLDSRRQRAEGMCKEAWVGDK